MRGIIYSVFGLLLLGASAQADEMTTGEKMIAKAALLLETQMTHYGKVYVKSEDAAVVVGLTEATLTVEKVSDCVYALRKTSPEFHNKTGFVIINFRKLTGNSFNYGDSHSYGSEVQMSGEDEAMCRMIPLEGSQIMCFRQLRVREPPIFQASVDALTFIKRHGCD